MYSYMNMNICRVYIRLYLGTVHFLFVSVCVAYGYRYVCIHRSICTFIYMHGFVYTRLYQCVSGVQGEKEEMDIVHTHTPLGGPGPPEACI